MHWAGLLALYAFEGVRFFCEKPAVLCSAAEPGKIVTLTG